MGFFPNGPSNAISGVLIGGTAAAGSIPLATSATAGLWSAAPAVFRPANPATTASTTLVMAGLGSSVTFTPRSTGLVQVVACGGAGTLTSPVIETFGGRFGTGAAPAQGTAVTGTRFGTPTADYQVLPNAATVMPVPLIDLLSLIVGTAYWFDFAYATATAADQAQILNPMFVITEL